jgi:peptidylprolyl isomerase
MKFACLLLALLAATPVVAAKFPNTSPPQPVAGPSESDWRTPDAGNLLVIDTSKGRIIVEMAPLIAPLAVARVKTLARMSFYDGRAFFRVIDGFMDQTGDPKDNGSGSSALANLPPEFTLRRGGDLPFVAATKVGGLDAGFSGVMPVISQSMDLGLLTADNRVNAYATFCPGVAGMARADTPESGNSQFYLMRGANIGLDQKYSAWGRVIAGMDVVRAIKTGEPPAPPADIMTKVRVLADMPAADRPRVRVVDVGSPWFKASIARTAAEKAGDISICDIELPSQVK